jgi:hypothetical protein
MTIASPLSLRWERAQHMDRSDIDPLGATAHIKGKRGYSPSRFQPRRTEHLPF